MFLLAAQDVRVRRYRFVPLRVLYVRIVAGTSLFTREPSPYIFCGKWVIRTLLAYICESGMRTWSVGTIWSEIKFFDLQPKT